MHDIIRILGDLIAFDTTSRNSNLEFISYVEDFLHQYGIPTELTYDEDKGKANLFASLQQKDQPGIILSGHTDVVPVDGQVWLSDPFESTLKNSRIYGRGSCDMKGFIAVCLANITNILEARPAIPFHFAFSYDEEVGCVGAKSLITQLKSKEIMPHLCIVGEPTDMHVVREHKGMLYSNCSIHGKSSHSSQVNKGVNAVAYSARMINEIERLNAEFRKDGPLDNAFDPPHTSLHAGVIQGGIVNNIIPNYCRFEYEIRNLPGHSAESINERIVSFARDKLLPEMQKVSTDTRIEWESLGTFPALSTDENDMLNLLAKELLQQAGESYKVSYGTEAGLFHEAGIATIVCGPGSIDQAHKANEYVSIEQLERCDQFLQQLIKHYAT